MIEFPTIPDDEVREAYERAKARYAALGVDTDAAIERAAGVAISLHCWQADDVTGLEAQSGPVDGGGLMATGGYPGKAGSGDEIREDLGKVLSLVPGVKRVNLHAFYAETGGDRADRDALEPGHFGRWIEWAKAKGIGLDFNPTFFAHPKAASGFTLSHADAGIREFWVRHGIACRRIGEEFGRELGTPCVTNVWIPDGAKDSPADRWAPRRRLAESLDAIFADDHGIDRTQCVDAVESKLFGLGSEDYVVGSHEFYLGYAQSRGVVYCLDMGHFHPTEGIADKLSAVMQFQERLLLHVSRPVRWDSDHVVIFNDDLRNVFLELARGPSTRSAGSGPRPEFIEGRGDALDRAFVALDFFDASINRVAAYTIGARSTRKAILYALVEPSGALGELEAAGRNAQKLALMEELKGMPFGAVWDMLCLGVGAPVSTAWVREVEEYERDVLSTRGDKDRLTTETRRHGGEPR